MDARIHGTVTQKQASGKTQTIPAESTPRDCVRHINIKLCLGSVSIHLLKPALIGWFVPLAFLFFLSPVKVSDTGNV